MNQKLSDWASVAEILGAAAIVVSLIFVGYQIRQNTDYLRRTESNATMEQATAGRLLRVELAEILVKSRQGVGALSEVEELKLHTYFSQIGWAAVQMFARGRAGFSDAEDWQNNALIPEIRTNPTADSWWAQAKESFPSDFVDAFDQRLTSSP